MEGRTNSGVGDVTINRRTAISATLTLASHSLASCSAAIEREAPPKSTGIDSLSARAARKGLFYGTAVQSGPLRVDKKYSSSIVEDCNIIVPDAALMWNRIQSSERNKYDYSEANYLWKFATDNNIRMRGHALVWHNSLPRWFSEYSENMTPGQIGDILQSYVFNITSKWKGRVEHWTVVNEPVESTQLSQSIWNRKLGERYIDLAFEAAKSADDKALLCINQDLIEMDHSAHAARRLGILKLSERLRSRNVPVGGIGIQGHLNSGNRFSEIVYDAFLAELENFGFKTLISEFDIWDHAFPKSDEKRDILISSLAERFLSVSFSRKNSLGVLTWGQTSLYSWLQQVPSKWRADGTPNRGNVLDAHYNKTPLWHAFSRSFDTAPERSPRILS